MASRRVLLVHQFFAPDITTYAQMLDDFAKKLAEDGHDVTVACGPPSYNGAYTGPAVAHTEHRDGFTIRRLRVPGASTRRGKLLAAVLFPVAVVCFAWFRRRPFHVISVSTVPPVAMGVAGRLSAVRSRQSRFVYHCMDLYPEVAQALGVKSSGLLSRLSRAIDNSTVNAAEPTIVLSQDMKDTLRRRGADTKHVEVNNNFIIHPTGVVAGCVAGDTYQLVFAGNIGRFQGLEVLIDAIAEVSKRGRKIEMLFLGNGAMVEYVENRRVEESLPIRLVPHRPLTEAVKIMTTADLAVVSLAPEVIRAAYPSKTMMYLELGLPILAAVESDSELATLVRGSALGVVPMSQTPSSIAQAIEEAMGSEFNRDNIQRTGRELFNKELVLERWARSYGLSEAAG